jgi:hypothetical protein
MKHHSTRLVLLLLSILPVSCLYPPVGIDAAQDFTVFSDMSVSGEVAVIYGHDDFFANDFERYDFQWIHLLTNPESATPSDGYIFIPQDYDAFVAGVRDAQGDRVWNHVYDDLYTIGARVRGNQQADDRNVILFPNAGASAEDWVLLSLRVEDYFDGTLNGTATIASNHILFPALSENEPATVAGTWEVGLELIYETTPPPASYVGPDRVSLQPIGVSYVAGPSPSVAFLDFHITGPMIYLYEVAVDVANLNAPVNTDFTTVNELTIGTIFSTNSYAGSTLLYGRNASGTSYLCGYETEPDVTGSRWEWYTWQDGATSASKFNEVTGRFIAVLSDGSLIYEHAGRIRVRDTNDDESSFSAEGFQWQYEYYADDGQHYAIFSRSFLSQVGTQGAVVLRSYREPMASFMASLGLEYKEP